MIFSPPDHLPQNPLLGTFYIQTLSSPTYFHTYAALIQHHWALHLSALKSTTTTAISPSASTPTLFVPPYLWLRQIITCRWSPHSGTPFTVPLKPLPGHVPVPNIIIPIILRPILTMHSDCVPNHSNNSKKKRFHGSPLAEAHSQSRYICGLNKGKA